LSGNDNNEGEQYMLKNAELWKNLEALDLDDPQAAFQFTDRLAHENGWPAHFAKRAALEYKRFVYLAAISPTPVTPSDIVDQVWHLHLTFTRSYWDVMCNRVLGKPLHHGPTKGGADEDAKYRSQYGATLALYRTEFGTEPPIEFWPSAEDRFASAQHQRWIDTRTHVVFRKPKLTALWAGSALAFTGAVAATGTAAADAGSDGDKTTAYLVMGGVAAAATILFATMFAAGGKRNARRRRDKGNGGDASFIASTGCTSSGGKGKGQGGEGGEGGEGGGDGGSGCGGGGGCGSS
jgi:hypothetical protein